MKIPSPHITLFTLFRYDLKRLINFYRTQKTRSLFATLIILLITAFFIVVEYRIALELFQHIMNQVHLEGLRYVLLAKILQMVYLIFTLLLVYSNIVMSISSFFLSPELDFQHSHPVSEGAIFTHSFFQTFIRSSWMFIAFGVPILLAYGAVMNQASLFPRQIFLIIIPSLILPTAIGVFIGILLIFIFSPRRTQRVFLIMGVFLAVGLVLVFRLIRPEQLVDPIGVEQVNFYLDTLRIPTVKWFPTTWASEGIAAYGEGRRAVNFRYGLILWSFTLIFCAATYWLFKQIWWQARSRGHGSESIEKGFRSPAKKQTRPNQFRSSLAYRDFLLFIRDPAQWSQIIIIAALVFIYIFNFKNLPYALYGFQYSMSFTSVLASGLILSAILARFGFPAVSMEGRAVWILKTSPINWRRYLWQKFAFMVIPTTFVGSILVLFSLKILDAPPPLIIKCLLTETAIAFSCTGLAVGIGAGKPKYELTDAAMVAVSVSGLVYMIFAVTAILSIVGLVVLPDTLRYMSWGWRLVRHLRNFDRIASWITLGIAAICYTIIPLEIGIRRLRSIGE